MRAKSVLTNSTVVALRVLVVCAVGVDLQAEDRMIIGYETLTRQPNLRANLEILWLAISFPILAVVAVALCRASAIHAQHSPGWRCNSKQKKITQALLTSAPPCLYLHLQLPLRRAAAAGPVNERQRVTRSLEKRLIPNEIDSKLPRLRRGL
jgi:hypothetical protein